MAAIFTQVPPQTIASIVGRERLNLTGISVCLCWDGLSVMQNEHRVDRNKDIIEMSIFLPKRRKPSLGCKKCLARYLPSCFRFSQYANLILNS